MAERRTKKDAFFERRREWARYKHEILGKYLRGWFAKLARRGPFLAFVDTCAGEGKYGDDEDGSPLIAAKLNTNYARSHGQRLLVFACEAHPGSADALERNLAEFIESGEAVVLREEFGTALPQILRATRDIPTLVFIDPYGMKDLRGENLRALLEDTDREATEVIMRVPPQLLRRFMGQVKRGDKTAEAFKRLLVDQLGIDAELIDQAADADSEVDIGEEELLESFLRQIHERFEEVHLIPVRDNYYAPPKYYLVHGTRSEHGLVLMNDVVSKTEDNLYNSTEAKKAAGQVSLFEDPGRQPRIPQAEIEKLIVRVVVEKKQPTWLQIQAESVRTFGTGELREMHLRAIVRSLEERGMVKRLPVAGKNRAYDRFVLGENWKP